MFLLVSCVVQQQPGWAVGKVYTIPESEMGQYKKRSNSSADRKKKTAQTVVPKAQRGGLGDGLSVAGRTIISTTNGQSMEWKFTEDQVTMIGSDRTLYGEYKQRGKNLYFSFSGKNSAAVYDGNNIIFAEKSRPAPDYTKYQKPYADDCVKHDGYYRCWYIHVPENLNGTAPLLVDMHGFGDNPEQQKMLTGFDHLADEEKFIVAWPLGMNFSWNAGPLCCGHSVSNNVSVKDNVDDVGFLRKMIAKVISQESIDQHRVYVTGFSNGSAMAQRFANEASDIVAATASLASYLLVPKSDTFSPVPMLEIHGTKDSVVNWSSAGRFPGALKNLSTWAAMNKCSGEPVESWREGPHYALTFADCQQGVEVTLVTVHEGGHVIYPSVGSRINTTAMVWDFMKRFSK